MPSQFALQHSRFLVDVFRWLQNLKCAGSYLVDGESVERPGPMIAVCGIATLQADNDPQLESTKHSSRVLQAAVLLFTIRGPSDQ
ncbi:hypothetical protein GUJ93_ZPchr0007g6264 [Zizania palustris]|uniref:Uncharacterized protein n=1 Tax=Zizania palustris TaxID=103762 RepID=A0A8J5TIU9_ZIZPA|nr:hypothetical protein GUJ93_ZPchr0007g6264 [Zizania palustris]